MLTLQNIDMLLRKTILLLLYIFIEHCCNDLNKNMPSAHHASQEYKYRTNEKYLACIQQ